MTRAWLVWVLIGLVTAGAAGRQAPQVRAELSRTSVYVGDEVIYTIVVQGDRPADQPEVVFPSSVRAQDMGVSESSFRSIRMINGRRTEVNESSLVYQYRVTAVQPGVVEIPPATVRFPGGRQLQTGATRFEALLPQLASDFDLWLELDRSRLYVGETIRARVVWMIPESIGPNFDFGTSLFDPSLDVSAVAPAGAAGQMLEFRFFGSRAIAVTETVFDAGGRQRVRFTFDVEITPRRAGIVDIGPLRVVFDRGGSGGPRVYVESDPVTVQVLDLPTEGRPADFTGLIGRYELRTLASPTTVNVGDPITVRAELRGEEPMVGADSLPELAGQPGFERFRLSGEGWREEQPRERGRRVFATVVRALSADVTELPSVSVWAFDPELEQYVAVRSEPVQLDVRSVREATLADAVVAPGGGRAAGPGPLPRIGPGDAAFWAPPTLAEIESDRPFVVLEQLARPTVIAAIASGPAAVIGAGVFAAVRRRRDRPAMVRDRALRQAEHLVLRAGPAAGVRAAGAAVLGCDRSAVTAADIERLGVHPGIVRTLREAIEADEAGGGRPGQSPEDTRLAIRTLRRTIRREPAGEVGR